MINGIEPHRVHVGGSFKFKFNQLPKDLQEEIKDRLAEKDPTMAKGKKGILPGIKIDGKQITRDNIKEFEIPKMGAKPKKKVVKKSAKRSRKSRR